MPRKLYAFDYARIRALYRTNSYTQKELAEKYNISLVRMNRILAQETPEHLKWAESSYAERMQIIHSNLEKMKNNGK